MKNTLMKEFGKHALATFKEALSAFGFKCESKKTAEYFCNIVFVNGERYVEISANSHPRDFPPYFNIVLGEGSHEFPESDWNSIALWRVKNLISSTDSVDRPIPCNDYDARIESFGLVGKWHATDNGYAIDN